MEVVYGIKNIGKFSNAVVALGVFDGVHLAHRKVLRACARKAKDIKGSSIVLTFWPHPQKRPALYSLEHRLKLIAQMGIDACIVINFNKKFAALSAQDFIHKVLVEKLRARYIFIGKNFRFGRFAAGEHNLLKQYAKDYHYRVKVINVIKRQGNIISSTLIRKLIASGKLRQAQSLLSRPVNILGTVVRGSSFATKLGFPTANINPHHEILPPAGIYAVKVLLGHRRLNGICYIGTRPTLKVTRLQGHKVNRSMRVEAHIFDFNQHIYGRDMELQFIRKIRDEKKFPSFKALAEQIKKDASGARQLLIRH
jgi:riboflavin kinase/FMN adenylyltransferase